MGELKSTRGRTAPTPAALDAPDVARVGELQRTKLLADAVLIASLAVLVVAKLLERHNPTFGFLAAFAEAATIGGLADWYAVVSCSNAHWACRTPIRPSSRQTTRPARGPTLRPRRLTASLASLSAVNSREACGRPDHAAWT
jgi:hypothetical protein